MWRATTDMEIAFFIGQHSCMNGCRRRICEDKKKLNNSRQKECGCESGNCSRVTSLWTWDLRVISQEVFLTGSAGYHLGGPSWAVDNWWETVGFLPCLEANVCIWASVQRKKSSNFWWESKTRSSGHGRASALATLFRNGLKNHR